MEKSRKDVDPWFTLAFYLHQCCVCLFLMLAPSKSCKQFTQAIVKEAILNRSHLKSARVRQFSNIMEAEKAEEVSAICCIQQLTPFKEFGTLPLLHPPHGHRALAHNRTVLL